MRFKMIILVLCFGLTSICHNPFSAVLAQSSPPCPTCPGSQHPQPSLLGQYVEDLQYQEVYSLFKDANEDWQTRKWDQAIDKYRSVTQRVPSTSLAALSHMKIGLFLKYRNRWDEAIDEFQRGITLVPGTREAHDAKTSIACIYTSRGMYDEAITLLREVLTETKDWDQLKYCSGWLKSINILKNQTKQSKSESCGPKTLSMIFKMKGIEYKEPGEEISTIPPSKGNQTSMEELRKIAKASGLHAYGVRMTIDQLNTVELPVIALLRPGHFIVVQSVDQEKYKIIDPERGERLITIYSKEIIERDWTEYVLAFGEEIKQQAGLSILTQKEMGNLYGGVCSCCPSGYLGGEEDYPNIVFDKIEGPIKGCVSRGGMPKILVNTYTLNLVVEDIDLSYSGLGPRVEIKRTYNSDDPRETVFGKSWTFNYNISLYEDINGGVALRRGSGKIDQFNPLGGGRYSSPIGVYDELTKNLGDGTYSLWIKKERLTYHFDTHGRLTSIADQNNNAVTFQNEEINPPLIWGSYGAENGKFYRPRGIAVDQSGNIYVADTENHRIQKFDNNGNFLLNWGEYGSGDAQFYRPHGVAIDQAGHVLVADYGNHRIQKFGSNGNFISQWGSLGSGDGQFNFPAGVSVNQSGHVYVADAGNHRIQKFDNNGAFLLKWGSGSNNDGDFVTPYGVAVGPSGHVYVADSGNHRIQKFDSNGTFLLKWGGYGLEYGWGQFNWPVQLAVDQSGYVYVADSYNNRIQKFDDSGNYITQWGVYLEYIGEFQFNRPSGVAVDQSGHVYVSDTLNNRIKKFLSNLPTGIFLTSITDAVGRITTFTYWEDYKVHIIRDHIGREANFTYENGNLRTQTDMDGNTVIYDYQTDIYMDMKSITTSSGTTWLGYYNSWLLGAHYLNTITDPLGNTKRYWFCRYPEYSCPFMGQYDTGIKDARDNWMYYYNAQWCGPVTVNFRNSLGNQTSFGYDGNCNRTSITNANGDTTTIGYNAYGDITSIKDPECAQQNPPCQTTFTYWNHGGFERDYLKEIIDPRNTNYKYTFQYSDDGKWNLRFITDPLNKVTEFVYYPSGKGQLKEFIDARLNKTTFTYDSDENLETVTGPNIGSPPYALVTRYGYDGVSRLTSITDPRNNTTNYEYDGIDRLKKITFPGNKTIEYGYFCCGQNSMKDENGKITTYQPDADNRLWKIFDPGEGVTEYQYDANGNLRYLIDPEIQTTEFKYFNQVDRLQTITYPEGLPAEELDYYPAGNLKWKKTRKGQQTDYGYNKNIRLTSLSGPGVSISYAYDKAGNIDSMTDATGFTDFEHDELNRLKYVIYPSGKRIDYTYNEVGKLETITTAFGTVVYNYDAYNRLSTITLPNAAGIIDYHYDENNYKGNLTSVHYPNGSYTTFDYENSNRLTGLTNNRPGGIISQYMYTLDGVGNRINVSFEEPLSREVPLETIGYNYDDGNFLTSAGTATYNYDLNGNLYTKTKDGNTTTYTFDSQDRLTGVSSSSLSFQYQYDGLFNRVSKTDSGTTTKYLVDPNGFLPQVIAEMDSGGNITSYYVYDGIGLVAKMSGSNVYYYHYGGSGNTIAMTDSSGTMVNKYAYDEFGNLLNAEESVPNPFLFVGQYGVMDDDNGLLYMRARYYDPEVGRFINKDPIGYLGGDQNLFCYVQNNPVNWVDPWGLWTLQMGITGTGGGGLGGTAEAGIVFGYSAQSGFQFGTYETLGIGGFGGLGGSVTLNVSYSRNTNINQLCGKAGNVGVSAGEAIVGGFEVNIMEGAKPSYTGSIGFGALAPLPFEGHGFVTKTWIQERFKKKR